MKKSILVLSIMTLLATSLYLQDADALRQVAGKIEIDIKPGQTKTFEWGLASDNKDKPTKIEISSEKEGSQFLSFEKNITLQPQELKYITVTVSVPSDYPGGIKLEPLLYATEFGETGGATIINIKMLKVITLDVAPNDDPSLWVDWDKQKLEQEPILAPEPEQLKQEIQKEKKETMIVQPESAHTGPESEIDPEPVGDVKFLAESESNNGGGCLVATAAFGTELAPQIQMLREIRDLQLMQTESGSTFVQSFNAFYYSFAPTVAQWERDSPVFKEVVKAFITPLIASLSLLQYVSMDSESKVLGYGIGVIMLNLGIYFIMPTIIIWQVKKRFN